MSGAVATLTKNRYVPPVLGVLSLVIALLLVELLIRVDIINRYIVPTPSDIIAAFPRVIVEEDVLNRFLLTAPPLRLPGAVGSPATPVATV